jgi:dsRNA-specific ribonuclease
MNDINDPIWLSSLQLFIDEVLERIIPDPNERLKYIDDRAMTEWAEAFTYITYSYSFNSEKKEYFGDRGAEWSWSRYTRKRFPFLNEDGYTNLKNAYMSKLRQGGIADELGFGHYVRMGADEGGYIYLYNEYLEKIRIGEISQDTTYGDYVRTGVDDRLNTKIYTDLFESFFGGLEAVGDLVHDGLGILTCYNMMVEIFKDREIDISLAEGPPKTVVIQMFTRHGLNKPQGIAYDSNTTTVSIEYNADKCTAGTKKKVTEPSDKRKGSTLVEPIVIAESTKGADSESFSGGILARMEAAEQAIAYLEKQGIVKLKTSDTRAQGGKYNVKFSVKLKPAQINFLREEGVNIRNPLIGQAEASTKSEAESNAYFEAMNTLAKLGVTKEWAKQISIKKDLDLPELRPFLGTAKRQGPAIKKMLRQKYSYLYFSIPSKTRTKTSAIVLLLGAKQDKDGNEVSEVLGAVSTPASDSAVGFKDAKVKLMKEYSKP